MQNDEEFRQILATVMLQREAGADVPGVWWQTLMLDAGELVRIPLPDGIHTGEQLLAAVHSPDIARYRRKVGEAKVKPVVEMLSHELQNSGEKVVVFAHHRSVLQELGRGLHTFGVVTIHGDVSPFGRDFALDTFQNDTACRVFLGQNQACGTGFDGLQKVASRCILVEPSWVKEENVQLGARLARMGQSANSVRAQMVCLAGTLDEWIVNQNQREAEMHVRMFPQSTNEGYE